MKLDKLKSRKFWVTLITANVLMFSDALGLNLTADQIYGLIAIVAPYLLAQGYVDGKKNAGG